MLRACALVLSIVFLLLAVLWPAVEEGATGCPAGFKSGTLPSWHVTVPGESQESKSSTIFREATIWTGSLTEPKFAEAFGVDQQGRIVSVGSFDEVSDTASDNVSYVGLEGAFVTPGFIDSHVHLVLGGLALGMLDLSQIRTRRDFVHAVQTAAENMASEKHDNWLLGNGWDDQLWGGHLPTRDWLDAATGGRPAWLRRVDGHMGVANTAALSLAGVDASTEDPPGGVIMRSADGSPTGILKDTAMNLVGNLIPQTSDEGRLAAIQRAGRFALSHGITAVHDMGDISMGLQGNASAERIWRDLEIMRSAEAKGELPLRVHAYMPLASWNELSKYVAREGWGSARLTWGGTKAFMDGSLGSYTAWFHEPYADNPSSAGIRVEDFDWMRENIVSADAAGLQVAVHAIGDKAVDELIAHYSHSADINGPRDRRFRIEHAQHLSSALAARQMAAINTTVSAQPMHLPGDRHIAPNRLGHKRSRWSYAFRTLQDAGVHLTFGSDWTVAPLDVLDAVRAAHRRMAPEGDSEGPWIPEEAVSSEEALHAFTQASAYASFRESELGELKPGAFADFVVLSDSPWSEIEMGGDRVKVLKTYMDGKCVWSSEEKENIC